MTKEQGDFEVKKTKGQATQRHIEAGESSIRERASNNHVDAFAEEGAKLAQVLTQEANNYIAAIELARQAAIFAATAHVAFADSLRELQAQQRKLLQGLQRREFLLRKQICLRVRVLAYCPDPSGGGGCSPAGAVGEVDLSPFVRLRCEQGNPRLFETGVRWHRDAAEICVLLLSFCSAKMIG